MELELFPLLSTIILVSTIVTIVFAFFSYVAYRAREKKGFSTPSSILTLQPPLVPTPRPQIFRRYEPTR